MKDVIQFMVLGLGLGAIYALLASSVVLVYQSSGIVDFAHGAFALGGAAVFYELHEVRGVPLVPSLLAVAGTGTVFGWVMQNGIMRQMRTAAPITRVIATLGVLISFEAAAGLHYGDNVRIVKSYLPQANWEVAGILVQSDRIYLLLIAVFATGALTLVQRRTTVGLAVRGLAQNERYVSALGWSPNALGNLNWIMGATLAALAGALIAPISGLIVVNLVLLVVPALAAALLGRFASFGLALAGALGIGMIQSVLALSAAKGWFSQSGAGDAVPFLLIIVILVITGRSLPLRSHTVEKLPSIGRGTVRPGVLVLGVAVLSYLLVDVFNVTVLSAFTITFAVAVLVLSVVVLTGYAGQISLAQYALAGLGAFVSGRLVAAEGWPYWAAFLAGIAAAVPIGVVFALPALRTRGVTLVVVTLGMGVAVNALVFQNQEWTGGIAGTNVGFLDLFSWRIDQLYHPQRYAMFTFIALLLACFGVLNLRRSASGRRMIAIRENERAAASLGISVFATKLQAFAVASFLAAVAGIMLAFSNSFIIYETFDPISSIFLMAWGIIGGLGYIPGALFGGNLAPGGTGALFNLLIEGIKKYIPLIGAVGLLQVLIVYADGFVPAHLRAGEWAHRKGKGKGFHVPGARAVGRVLRAVLRVVFWANHPKADLSNTERERVKPLTLEVENLIVRFGGTTAVNGVSVRVQPGEVVGMIGANGAGKTTLVDAVTGFVRSSGSVRLGGTALHKIAPHRRASAGVSRSWQSLELFEDVSVLENLQVASESRQRRWWHNIQALVWPPRSVLTAAAVAAIEEFELEDDLDRKPSELSYGRRRLVAIARAVALNPSILLLDEPAAGLTDVESRELGALIRRLAESWGMGVLMIEHDVDLVMGICDRIVVLDFGRKIAEGLPEEVRNDPAVVAAYLGGAPEAQVTTESSG